MKYDELNVIRDVFPDGSPCFKVYLGVHRIGTVRPKGRGFVGNGARKPKPTLEDAVIWEAYRNVRRHISEAAKLANAANQVRPGDFRPEASEETKL